MARYLVAVLRVAMRRACQVVVCNRAMFYYRSQRRDVTPLRMRLRELAAVRPRFGYRQPHIPLRREGWRMNHKKTYRLYREVEHYTVTAVVDGIIEGPSPAAIGAEAIEGGLLTRPRGVSRSRAGAR
jgi:transposase InsO family protein